MDILDIYIQQNKYKKLIATYILNILYINELS